MAAGSPRIIFRCPPLLLAAIDAEIARTNRNVKVEPFNRSTWVLAAISQKLAHAARSRKTKRKKNIVIHESQDVGQSSQ